MAELKYRMAFAATCIAVLGVVACVEQCQFTQHTSYRESCRGRNEHFTCPEGQRKVRPCLGANWTTRSCVPCEDGFFQDKPNNCTECRPCSECPEGQRVSQACTAERDTECEPEVMPTTRGAGKLKQGPMSTQSPTLQTATQNRQPIISVTSALVTNEASSAMNHQDVQHQADPKDLIPNNSTVCNEYQGGAVAYWKVFLIALACLVCGIIIGLFWGQIKGFFKGGNNPGGSAPI